MSRSSEGVDPQERTRMLAEQRRNREFEVCEREFDDGATLASLEITIARCKALRIRLLGRTT